MHPAIVLNLEESRILRRRCLPEILAYPKQIMSPTASERLSSRRIIGYVYFTFVVYLAIGLPLAILPARMCISGWGSVSAALAGLVISIQYIYDVFEPAVGGADLGPLGREGECDPGA